MVYAYWDECHNRTISEQYQKALEMYAFPEFGTKVPSKILTADLNRSLNKSGKQGCQERLLLQKALKEAFCFMQEYRMIGRDNPFDQALLLKEPEKVLHVFTEDEYEHLFDAAGGMEKGAAVKIGIAFGLKMSIMAAIRKEDLEWVEVDESNDHCNGDDFEETNESGIAALKFRPYGIVHIRKMMRGRNIDYLDDSAYDLFVDWAGMNLFEELVQAHIDMRDEGPLLRAIRAQSGVQDFTFSLAKKNFLLRQFRSGTLPVEIRDYYGESKCHYFDFIVKFLGDVSWDEM